MANVTFMKPNPDRDFIIGLAFFVKWQMGAQMRGMRNIGARIAEYGIEYANLQPWHRVSTHSTPCARFVLVLAREDLRWIQSSLLIACEFRL